MLGCVGRKVGGGEYKKESGMRRVSYVMRERKEGNDGNSSIVKKIQHKKHTLY